MLGILQPCIASTASNEAWPDSVIGSLCSWWVIGLQGYKTQDVKGKEKLQVVRRRARPEDMRETPDRDRSFCETLLLVSERMSGRGR